MNEEWRPIPGYEGLYEVSDLGRVRSVDHVTIDSIGRRKFYKGRILRPNLTGTPRYPTIRIWNSGVGGRTQRVHLVVLAAFVGPRPEGARHVRHLNGNPLDNRLINLAYGTAVENGLDMVRHGNGYWANKTHCRSGHEYTAENTYVYYSHRAGIRRPRRRCQSCFLERQARKTRRAA